MELPLQITYHGTESNERVDAAIRDRAQHLDRFHDRITSCRVVVDLPHRRHESGNNYHVRVDITVPGSEIVVNHDHPENPAHQDVLIAIHDAFAAAERQLHDFSQRHRGAVKVHQPTVGRVAKLFPEEGFGFIEDGDMREIYFHRHSVLDGGFARLTMGTEVRYVEEMGEKGPQASTVSIVAKAHPQ